MMSTPHLNSTEQVVWQGTPSQWNNVGAFVFCTLFFWAIIPILVGIWRWLVVKNTHYILTNERLFNCRGVLNKRMDELELYRIKDYSQTKTLLMRMVGLGTVTILTSDRTNPSLCLSGIAESDKVQGLLREHTERRKVTRGVRELDY